MSVVFLNVWSFLAKIKDNQDKRHNDDHPNDCLKSEFLHKPSLNLIARLPSGWVHLQDYRLNPGNIPGGKLWSDIWSVRYQLQLSTSNQNQLTSISIIK
jgi:hypothetical protein